MHNEVMTVEKMIEKLMTMPKDMQVWVYNDIADDYFPIKSFGYNIEVEFLSNTLDPKNSVVIYPK
jgi:hypothetical protein